MGSTGKAGAGGFLRAFGCDDCRSPMAALDHRNAAGVCEGKACGDQPADFWGGGLRLLPD